jgi:hypothetical protein
MSVTYSQATDQLYSILQTVIGTYAVGIVGYIPNVYWPGDVPPLTVDGSKFFVRVSRQNIDESQATLSSEVGAHGQKRFTTRGLLVVQIFCPQSTLNASNLGAQLAVKVRDAYRKADSADGCWFTNCRVRELPPEDVFHRYNVLMSFKYDEIL